MRKNLQMILTLALVAMFSLGAAAQPKSGYYKVQNVKTKKYVDVKSSTYAKPDAEEADATVLYVGIGDEWDINYNEDGTYYHGDPDGSYKVISLSGEGVQVYTYVNYCVNLAYAFIDIHMADPTKVGLPLTEEEVELAKEAVKDYAENTIFMRLIPNGTNVYAVATVPMIPDWVEEKAREHGVTDGAWNWAVRQVLSRLDRLGEFGIGGFKDLIANNLPNIVPGTTYYLTADEDNTFGYLTEAEFNALTNAKKAVARWTMHEVETQAFAESGYYRIRNAAGVDGKAYVNVDGRYTAEPDATADEATTEAGTVIYVGMEGIPAGKTKITGLSGQSDDVLAYADKAITLAKQFAINALEEAIENSDYEKAQQLKDELLGILDNKVADWTERFAYLYLVPTITDNHEDAVYCQVTMPGLSELDEQVAGIFNGTSGYTISESFAEYGFFRTDPNVTDSQGRHPIIGLDTTAVWNFAVEKLIAGLEARGSDPAIQALVRNNMRNVVPGHTYILTQDPDGTFGYLDICDENGGRDEAKLAEMGDAGRWVLEPVKNDGNYFAVNPTLTGTDEDGATKYVTTLYTDFPYTLSEGMKAYAVTGAEAQEGIAGLVIVKEEVPSPVPANMAVLLICDQTGAENNKLEPVAPAAETEAEPAEPTGAPRKAKRTDYDANAGNLLYADHFNGNAGQKQLLALGNAEDGLAFVNAVTTLDGNVAVLDIAQLDTSDAYYVFPVKKNPQTAIDSINGGKAVASVRYINVAGVKSDKAFDGMNIVVTTYTDGTQSVAKVVR
ncbi:MAG: UvrB/UvrC motif-containing protein [Muribaculaceae bacterium]|nr:UvrB/UvrC motif-containing protein [Muribaculaceae bacterium]